MIGIYEIENTINGKKYIGQSKDIHKRFTAHRNRYKNKNYREYESALYCDMRKFGIENFKFSVIEECEACSLHEREEYWISRTNSMYDGYNILPNYNYPTHTKLTNDDVNLIIKELRNTDCSTFDISKKFGVTERTIRDINAGRSWKNDELLYPIRNNKNKNVHHCSICGKEIKTKDAKYCVDCGHASERKIEWPSKNELEKMINSMSKTKIGKLFGVSFHTVNRWCKSYGII